jgi:hypothetical protein
VVAAGAEVVGEVVEPGRRPPLRLPLESRRDSPVEQSPASRDETLVQRLLHQPVRKGVSLAVAAPLLAEQLMGDELLQRLDECFLGDVEHLAERVEVDAAANDGGGRECVESRRTK